MKKDNELLKVKGFIKIILLVTMRGFQILLIKRNTNLKKSLPFPTQKLWGKLYFVLGTAKSNTYKFESTSPGQYELKTHCMWFLLAKNLPNNSPRS